MNRHICEWQGAVAKPREFKTMSWTLVRKEVCKGLATTNYVFIYIFFSSGNFSGISEALRQTLMSCAFWRRLLSLPYHLSIFEDLEPSLYAPIKSKLQHPPPGQSPGIWTFEEWIVQIPAPSGQNGVQMPYPFVRFVCQMSLLKNNRRRFVSSVIKLVYIRGTQRH